MKEFDRYLHEMRGGGDDRRHALRMASHSMNLAQAWLAKAQADSLSARGAIGPAIAMRERAVALARNAAKDCDGDCCGPQIADEIEKLELPTRRECVPRRRV